MTFLFQLVLKNQNCTFSGADPGFSEGEGGLGGGGGDSVPTLSNCYCNLTSPFFTRKSMVPNHPNHPLDTP